MLLRRRWTPRKIATALLVIVGLVSIVPEFSLANRTVQGLAWGCVSGFAFALLTVLNRRYVATRKATDIAFWQNLCAALCLLPFAWASPWALGDIGGREIALGIVLALVLQGEVPGVRTIVGGALIVGAAIVATRYPMR